MKTLRENYTSVCWRCGVIFKSNRSTAKFCCPQHRPLYDKYGPHINPHVITRDNKYLNADHPLLAAYRSSLNRGRRGMLDGWGCGLEETELTERFSYSGPLPDGDVLLVAGSYVLKGETLLVNYQFAYRLFVKPITLLTTKEKATCVFISAPKQPGDGSETMEILDQKGT